MLDQETLKKLRAEHYEKDARIVYRDGRPDYCPKCDTSWPCIDSEILDSALGAERLRVALLSAQTVMRVLLAPGEHTSGCGCPEAVCVLRRETWSQIESALAGKEAV